MHTANKNEPQAAFVVYSTPMHRLVSIVQQLAHTNHAIWLEGETGVGKARVARLIHRLSKRVGPFVHVFCGTHGPVAFKQLFSPNGARRDNAQRKGAFEEARGGTLFLDDADELPRELTPRLLHTLLDDARRDRSRGISANARIVLASSLSAGSKTRADLRQCAGVIRVRIPPLRERRDDIRPLAEHFLNRFGSVLRRDSGDRLELTADSWQRLTSYAWPGNVQELKNVIKQTLLFSSVQRGVGLEVPHLR